MPDFTPDDIDIEPSEFVNACSTREINLLINELIEGGHIRSKDSFLPDGSQNINDHMFLGSLERLSYFRHLLTAEEEEYINKLAEKFKYLG